MDKLLSLEEAAEILGVEYKTVYRLVRSGRLPAGKVGRVYRLKREDLDTYFEESKRQVAEAGGRRLTPMDDLRCSVTGRRIVSELDIGGYASDTGRPICKEAWEDGWRASKGSRHEDTAGQKQGGA